MSLPLARVVDPEQLEGLRGPDGALVVTVPAAWLDEGARIRVRVPRLVTCAACEGGGCGQCGLSGALTTRERGEAEKQAELTLPRLPERSSGARLRLPCLGGESEEEQVPRGHLLVHVKPGEAPDPMVARLPGTEPTSGAIRPALTSTRLLVLLAIAASFAAAASWWLTR